MSVIKNTITKALPKSQNTTQKQLTKTPTKHQNTNFKKHTPKTKTEKH